MAVFDKKIILALLVLAVGIALAVYYQQKLLAYRQVLADAEAILVIDFGGGKERWFKGEVAYGMTVKDVLETSSGAGGFKFIANGALLEVDGLSNGKEGEWRCYVNSREVAGSLSKKVISPQDKVICKYR